MTDTTITNPVPASVRGWLYVVGIIVAALIPVLVIALPAHAVLIAAAGGAFGIIVASLARANLTPTVQVPVALVEDTEFDPRG
jgi:hypothetical protein